MAGNYLTKKHRDMLDDDRSAKVQRVRDIIEELMGDFNSEFGVEIEERALPNGDAWWFNLKDNPMTITLIEYPADNELYAGSIGVSGYLARLPKRNLMPLYRHLLETNRIVVEGAFSIDDNDCISFGTLRDVDTVDSKGELRNLVGMVALFRQSYVDELANEFGCVPLEPWNFSTS